MRIGPYCLSMYQLIVLLLALMVVPSLGLPRVVKSPLPAEGGSPAPPAQAPLVGACGQIECTASKPSEAEQSNLPPEANFTHTFASSPDATNPPSSTRPPPPVSARPPEAPCTAPPLDAAPHYQVDVRIVKGNLQFSPAPGFDHPGSQPVIDESGTRSPSERVDVQATTAATATMAPPGPPGPWLSSAQGITLSLTVTVTTTAIFTLWAAPAISRILTSIISCLTNFRACLSRFNPFSYCTRAPPPLPLPPPRTQTPNHRPSSTSSDSSTSTEAPETDPPTDLGTRPNGTGLLSPRPHPTLGPLIGGGGAPLSPDRDRDPFTGLLLSSSPLSGHSSTGSPGRLSPGLSSSTRASPVPLAPDPAPDPRQNPLNASQLTASMNAQPQPLTEEFLRALQEQQAQRSGSTIFTTHTNPNWPYKYATYSVNPTSPEHARAIFELLGMVTTHTQQNPSSTFTLIHHLTSIGISAVGPGGFLAAIASVTGITLTRAHFTNEYLPELFNTLEKFAISINRVPAATLLAMTKAFIISKTTTYTPQTFVIALLDFCTKQFSTIPSNVLATTPLISHMLDAISDTLLRKEVILLLDAIYGRTIYGNPRPGVNYDPQPIFQLPSGASFNPAEYKNALGLEALQALAARLLTAACGDDPRVPPRFFEENFLSLRSNKTSSRGGAASEPTPPQASPSDKASQPCVIPGHKGSHTNGECNAQKALCENPLCNRAGRHKRVNHTAGECHRGFYLKTRETPTSSTPTARVAAVQPAPTSTPVTVAAAPQAGGGGGSGSASAPTCNYCKEPGHLIADCSKRKAKDEAREKAGLPPYVPKRSQTPGTRASSTPRARGPGGPLVTAGLFAAAATLPAPGSGFSIYLPWANISTDFCYNPVPYAANYTIASTSTGPGSLMMQMACPGPECEGTIFGHPVKTTLDSGASISVMPANVLYAIQRASPFNLKVTPCSPLDRIATAFGTLVPQEELVGTVDLPLHVIYNITPAGLPTSNVEFCQSVRFLVIKYPDSQTPPPIYIGGKSL